MWKLDYGSLGLTVNLVHVATDDDIHSNTERKKLINILLQRSIIITHVKTTGSDFGSELGDVFR